MLSRTAESLYWLARYIERATMDAQQIMPIGDVGEGNAPYFSMILVHKRDEVWK